MSTTDGGVLSRLRRPEYTGENRCVPCTVVNTVLAVALALVVGLAWYALAGAGWWLVVGAVLVVSALSIWLRGYLVPGTPELTKRYLPDWLLAKFDKGPAASGGGFAGADTDGHTASTDGRDGGSATANDGETGAVEAGEDGHDHGHGHDVDPERLFLQAGVVEPCAEVDDLCLDERFQSAWRDRMATLRESGAEREEVARQLDVSPEAVTFEEHEGGAFTAHHDGTRAGQWESRAAMIADVAAARELPGWIDGWTDLTPAARSRLLGGLRIFVQECPTCGGPVTAGQETVESCCRSYQVVAASCESCGARLLEVPYEGEAA